MTYKKKSKAPMPKGGSSVCYQHESTPCAICTFSIPENAAMIVTPFGKALHVGCSDFVPTALFLLPDIGAWSVEVK